MGPGSRLLKVDEKEEGIATAAIESEKYFGSICLEVTFQMLDEMGLDQRIWKPMLNFIAHLRRFNKVARTWTCTNSIMQGWQELWRRKYRQSSASALWMIADAMRRENQRQNSCSQPSRPHATSTRRQDSIH